MDSGRTASAMVRRRREAASRLAEPLEDRTLLATFVVTEGGDSAGLPGVRLRDAVAQANMSPGLDLIIIDDSVNSLTISEGEIVVTDSVQMLFGGRFISNASFNGAPAGVHRSFRVTASASNVVFEDGRLTRATAAVIPGNGGGVHAIDATVQFRDFSIDRHNVSGDGGGVWSDSVVTATDSSFTNNVAAGDGGGIAADGVSLFRAVVQSNTANRGGGIVSTGNAIVRDSQVNLNTATTAGGGFYVEGDALGNTQVSLTQVSAQFNRVDAGNGAVGAFSDVSSLTISDGSFSQNTASGSGGAFSLVNCEGVVSDSIFFAARATDGGALAIVGGALQVRDTRFGLSIATVGPQQGAGNIVTGRGGDLFISGGLHELVRLASLEAEAARGGFAYVSGATVTGRGLLLDRVKASARGGAIELVGGAQATMHSSNIVGAETPGSGGAVAIAAGSALELVGSQIRDSVANVGGAIYSAGGVVLRETAITGNRGGAAGGGVVLQTTDASLQASDSVFASNTTTGRGGAIATFGGAPVNLVESNVRANEASRGGGFYAGAAVVRLVRSALAMNSATEGGGGLAEAGSHVVAIEGASLVGNEATAGDGGALHLADSRVDINNSVLRSNAATGDGGAIRMDNATTTLQTLNLRNALAVGNAAGGSGGVAAVSGLSRANLLVGSFVSNTAATDGGAFWMDEGTVLFSKFATGFINNSAVDGGAVYSGGGAVTLTDTVFRGNVASSRGAGLFRADGSLQVRLNDVLFSKNRSIGNGGGLFTADRVTTTRSLFQTNRAAAGAGIFAAAGAVVDLTDDYFAFNVAGDTDGPGTFV